MSVANKSKIINNLRKGYTPIEINPKAELTSTYKNLFKPLVARKNLNFFLELFETNEVILRAWSFLGLCQILKEKSVVTEENRMKIQDAISEVLIDKREISYYGGKIEIQTSLREHHVRRICELNSNLIFKPVFDYCVAFENNVDSVIADLLEKVLAYSSEPVIEKLILDHGKKIAINGLGLKTQITKAFENYNQNRELNNKGEITDLFKKYLIDIDNIKNVDQDIINKKKILQENIFRVAAILELGLEEETLDFIESLEHPYHSLDEIAKKYKNNNRFKSILLKKLQETVNPHFITEILKSILIMKDQIENWKDLVIDKVKKYHIIDGPLITEMEDSNLINEDMILSLLFDCDNWSLEFIREFFVNNPEMLDEWQTVKEEFITILELDENSDELSDSYQDSLDKKEIIFKIIIDIQKEDLIKYCFENFKNLKDEKLRKIALFPILKFGEENLMLKVKELMKNDANIAGLVLNFIDSLNRNDWKFFY
ncbi:MAG: hypothetical protein ACTSP9_18315 [Promethearchaeota archaeon]